MQSDLPVLWKVFRIVNFLHLLGVVFLLLLFTYSFMSFSDNSTSTDYQIFLLFVAGGVVLLTNCICNYTLLEKIYPDKPITKKFSAFSLIVLIIAFIILLLLSITFVTVVYPALKSRPVNLWGKLVFFVLVAVIVTGYYSCLFQLMLKKNIRRNHKRTIDTFLNSDV